jgi:hypothetical protein
MSGLTIVIAAAIIGLILGSALVPGAPIFALPRVAILIVVLGGAEMRRRSADARSMQSFRGEADSDPIEFTERDKQTLVD